MKKELVENDSSSKYDEKEQKRDQMKEFWITGLVVIIQILILSLLAMLT
jgi:predicted negative regulator of RcsB-dependent stress response